MTRRLLLTLGLLAFSTPWNAYGQPSSREVLEWVNAATKLDREGSLAQAAALYEKVLPEAPRLWGAGSGNDTAVRISLAGLYYRMSQFAKAEPLYRQSLASDEKNEATDPLSLTQSLNNLGVLYVAMGQYAKAEPLHLRSLKICDERLGKDHPETARTLGNLGVMYTEMAQYAKAEPLYRRSLEAREAGLGKDHPAVAETLNNLANLYLHMGQFAKAEPLYRRSLEIREAKLGRNHPDVAASLNDLGVLYTDMGQYAKGEPLIRRSLEIREANIGNRPAEVAQCLTNLGRLHFLNREYAKAEPLARRCVELYEATFGKDHPLVGLSVNHLAIIYRDMGQFAKAEPLHRRGLEINEARLGKDHPDVAQSLMNLGWLSQEQGNWPVAQDYAQKGRRVLTRHIVNVLPSLDEKEQFSFLAKKVEPQYHGALSLGYARAADSKAAEISAGWLLNGKALVHQTLAEQYLLARDTKDPKAQSVARQLQETRAELAALLQRQPKSGQEAAYLQEKQTLLQRERGLARNLAQVVQRPFRDDPWIEMDEFRKKLPPKAIFVDIARFPIYEFKSKTWQPDRYVAWITPPQGRGDVRIIDLGEAGPIDRLIQETRQTLIDSAKAIPKIGEVEAVKSLQKPLKDLSAKVLHPLLPALEKYEEWIICPDGALWLTPWNALLLPTGEFAVEKHLIAHVVSGRDLVLDLPKARGAAAHLFADPDYDLSPGKVASGNVGIRSPLLGNRLRGAIGSWNVSFEFLPNEVVIYDEDDKGTVAGKGTWKEQAGVLTMQTGISTFQGTFASGEIRGQRSKRNPDGTILRDNFRLDAPQENRATATTLKTLPPVSRLPGTALEAEAIRPHIHKWLGEEPNLYLEEKASEALVKSVKNPRVLVLATHGYFLPGQEVEPKDRPGIDLNEGNRPATQSQPIDNPLLRCGLLLAGCNKRAEAKPGEDDGILTGLEIVGMNLQGCELVVLSACETGLGDVRSGEGVAGLRQAFQLAGAKGVLASLWQVPDRETALLMNAFYGEIAKGHPQTAALRQAQLERIAARKTNFGAAHPFFWAAFTLTNRGVE